MYFRNLLRTGAVILFLSFLLGPLSASTYSAAASIQLTSTHDVSGFEWTTGGDGIYVTRYSAVIPTFPSREESESDLYRISIATGAIGLLVRNASFPAPAPDGNRVAFLSLQNDGSARLRLLNLTSNATADLDGATWGIAPRWTRAGDQLTYASGNRALKLIPSTASRTALVSESVPSGFAASPGGDRLAFVAPDGLHLVTPSGDTNVFRTVGQTTLALELSWARDGLRLAFIVLHSGFAPELWVIDSNGENTHRLAHGGLEYFAGLDWAPDDSSLIFSRSPTGSSIAGESNLWRVGNDGSGLRALTQDHQEESSPKYSPDGKQIAFLRGDDVWVMSLGPTGLPLTAATSTRSADQEIPPAPQAVTPSNSPSAQLTPPNVIRVKHDQSNTCRNVPVGRIDTIDFETYVKRVVPAEVYASWPSESLMAQAVAARTYAWYWVLQHTSQNFDVTDSTAYQYMCDNQYPTTDSAVDVTRGQYSSYAGNLVFAAYGADNGDPTSTNTWGNPYLVAVDDPVDFGDVVSGNGIGMSQWGAERWASTPYSWNYQQILMHYYSGVTVQAPATGTPDSTPPIAGMVMPWSNWGVTGNRVFLTANASDDSSNIASINLIARFTVNGTTQTATLTPVYDGTYWDYLADMSSIPDQAGITVTPSVTDPNGNAFAGNGVRFTLDRGVPTGTVTAPGSTMNQTVTLNLSASDSGPSGLALMGFSNNWIWEGENQSVTNNSGSVVSDPSALEGSAMMGKVGTNPQGYWYGPYTNALPHSQSYRAYFRLKTDDNSTTAEVAMLDVVDNGGINVFGLRRLKGSDFRQANTYQEFYVDFDFTGIVTQGLEFRVAYRATADLWLDRVIVVGLPVPYAASSQWTLSPGNGPKTIQAKFIDGVGNVSADAVASIWFGPPPSPNPTATSSPAPTATPPLILTPEIFLPLIMR